MTGHVHTTVVGLAAVVVVAAGAFAEDPAKISRPAVSEQACPVEVVTVPVTGTLTTPAVVRRPPGPGPFPALIYLHGSLEPRPMGSLKNATITQPTLPRFLAAGYVVVAPTFRSRSKDPLTTDALTDCLAVVEYVKTVSGVDPKSVVVWGDSGGGSLALELAGTTPLCAVAAQEPATVLFTGVFSKENLGGKPPFNSKSGHPIMADPKKYYTPELERRTKEKIAKIACPVFIAHGDKAAINKINDVIVIPALKEAGKEVEVIYYPHQPHGFSHGGGSPEAALKFFTDCDAFFRKYLPTKPTPLDASLVKPVPAK